LLSKKQKNQKCREGCEDLAFLPGELEKEDATGVEEEDIEDTEGD
jgi:hypothetical protein